MGSNGGGGTTTTSSGESRYAPYVESYHEGLLSEVTTRVEAAIDSSPFSGYTDIEVEDAFFGAGYAIASFPSLYDMFGKFMAGLDVDALYSQLFTDTIDTEEVRDLVSAESALMEDDIDTNVVPRMQTGMRDINSVMSSSFVVGRSLIEDSKVKALAKFSAELKYRLIPVVSDRWKAHLDWNKGVILTYAELMKLYYAAKMDVDGANYSFAAKDALWPFTVLEFERVAIGVLQGAMNTSMTSETSGASQTQKAIGGALTGAAAGFMLSGGNPVGAGIGGALGLGASFL